MATPAKLPVRTGGAIHRYFRRCVSCRSGLWDSGLWSAFLPGRGKAIMAGKDKGGRSAKTPAAKSAKEKRQDKKNKKAAKGTMPT
jgi:hypothetical protein